MIIWRLFRNVLCSLSCYNFSWPLHSNISQGKPGNKVSQYTTGEIQKIFAGAKITPYNYPTSTGDGTGSDTGTDPSSQTNPNTPKTPSYDDWRRKLSPIVDTSFPVREFDILDSLTNALLWLNRKIQETITLDLISPVNNGIPSINHIVDFTERIKLDGNEYFLVSNRITFNPRKLIQKLQLIRWY